MAITDTLVLPADVLLVPVEDLPAQIREQLACEAGEYAITRPRSRATSKIIDAETATLLDEFRTGKTIVAAVIRYSRERHIDPEQTLTDVLPLIESFMRSRLLVPADSDEAGQITAAFERGDQIEGYEVLRCIQVLEDTELYQVQSAQGNLAALKIVRTECRRDMQRTFAREAAILQHLDGMVSPRLLEVGVLGERPYLILEWCDGIDAQQAAENFRKLPRADGRKRLLDLCCAILNAYAQLHRQNVIHSDVHPRNILVMEDGSVKIIDYGLARIRESSSEWSKAHRGGIPFFYEPEYTEAGRGRHKLPASSRTGEQYGLAALVYLLLTGVHYLDFSIEKDEMLRQIAEDGPLPFSARGIRPWPEVEEVLAKALSKQASDRFSSVAEFAKRLSEVGLPDEPTVEDTAPVDPAPAQALLHAVLERVAASGYLFSIGLPVAPICSVNTGAAGIAYALYRIASVQDDASLLSLADLWATKAARDMSSRQAFYNSELDLTPETVGQVTPYHTASGVHAVQALISHAMGDVDSQQAATNAFVSTSMAPCKNIDLTLGRSGTLLTASLLLDVMSDNDLLDPHGFRTFGTEVMRDIWEILDGFPPIREGRELTFLGLAHGWAGVLYATLRWCLSSGTTVPDTLQERLGQLGGCAEPIGRGVRWKRKLRSHRQERAYEYVPSWCNGSAGFVYLWTLADHMFRSDTYLSLAEKAAWNAWEDSEAVAGGLCCGAAGQAYALLNLYKHTRERHWLSRAQILANRVATAVHVLADLRDSLYKGEVGVAVLAADLNNPEEACMPFFEQEGWPR